MNKHQSLIAKLVLIKLALSTKIASKKMKLLTSFLTGGSERN